MAEQHLHGPQVGAMVQQVGRESVAQDVRADPVGSYSSVSRERAWLAGMPARSSR